MEKYTYVTEDGEVLFHPRWLPKDEGVTIIYLMEERRETELEQIADHLANVEQELERYKNTGLTPEQIREIDKLYLRKCQEVNALREENRWIPVSERMPDSGENEKYYDMLIISLDNLRVVSGFYRDDVGIWFGNLEGTIYKKITSKVIAWMPLPEPYRSEVLREAGAFAEGE